jgi:hypothetical protein
MPIRIGPSDGTLNKSQSQNRFPFVKTLYTSISIVEHDLHLLDAGFRKLPIYFDLLQKGIRRCLSLAGIDSQKIIVGIHPGIAYTRTVATHSGRENLVSGEHGLHLAAFRLGEKARALRFNVLRGNSLPGFQYDRVKACGVIVVQPFQPWWQPK